MKTIAAASLGLGIGVAGALLARPLLEDRREVLVLAREVPPGQPLTGEHLRIEEWPRRYRSRGLPASLLADAIGQPLASRGWAGELLGPQGFAAPPKPAADALDQERGPLDTYWDADGRLSGSEGLEEGTEVVVRQKTAEGWEVVVRTAEVRWAPAMQHTGSGGPAPGTFGLGIHGGDRQTLDMSRPSCSRTRGPTRARRSTALSRCPAAPRPRRPPGRTAGTPSKA